MLKGGKARGWAGPSTEFSLRSPYHKRLILTSLLAATNLFVFPGASGISYFCKIMDNKQLVLPSFTRSLASHHTKLGRIHLIRLCSLSHSRYPFLHIKSLSCFLCPQALSNTETEEGQEYTKVTLSVPNFQPSPLYIQSRQFS